MAKKTAKLHPSTAASLQMFGERLRLARKRRRLTARQVAELAGMAPMTLRSLERGGSGVTIGAYLSVMQVLGIERDIELLAKADPVGRELQDAQLSAPRRRRTRPLAPGAAKSPEAPVTATEHALSPPRSPGAAQSPDAANAPPGKAKEPPRESGRLAEKGLREKGVLPSAPHAPPPEQLRMEFDLPLDEPVQPAANGPAQTSIWVEDEVLAYSSDAAKRREPG